MPLDCKDHGPASLEKLYRPVASLGRLIGVKAKVIQRTEANRIRILINRESFRAPNDRACVLGNIPRRAAISSICHGAIMRPSGMLRRGVETDVADVSSKSYRHAEGSNGTIEVLVVNRVFIVPDTSRRVGYLIADNPIALVALVRFQLIYHPDGPRHDSWLLAHGGTCCTETKRLGNPEYGVLAVGSIVIHVALSWVTLAPCAFVRHDVLCLGKICCPWI